MATFWGEKQSVRHKIGGLVQDEMLDAEVTAKGIIFYRRGSSQACMTITWERAFEHSQLPTDSRIAEISERPFQPSPLNESAGLRIELVPDHKCICEFEPVPAEGKT